MNIMLQKIQIKYKVTCLQSFMRPYIWETNNPPQVIHAGKLAVNLFDRLGYVISVKIGVVNRTGIQIPNPMKNKPVTATAIDLLRTKIKEPTIAKPIQIRYIILRLVLLMKKSKVKMLIAIPKKISDFRIAIVKVFSQSQGPYSVANVYIFFCP